MLDYKFDLILHIGVTIDLCSDTHNKTHYYSQGLVIFTVNKLFSQTFNVEFEDKSIK